MDEKVAALRPGMDGESYRAAVPEPDRSHPISITTAFDLDGLFPPWTTYVGDDATVTIDHQDRISVITVPVDKLGLPGFLDFRQGVTLRGLLAAYPALVAPSPNEGGWQTYAGAITADGYEVSVAAQRGEAIHITIARAGVAEYEARRKAFVKADEADPRAVCSREDYWITIADPAAMLRDWAENIRDFVEEPDRFITYTEWLIRSNPDERHMAALHWNSSYGIAPLFYIVRQTDCDLATAFEIIHMTDPSFYDDNPPGSHIGFENEWRLVREIHEGITNARFTRQEIAFAGETLFDRNMKSIPAYDDAAFRRVRRAPCPPTPWSVVARRRRPM